MIVRLSIVAKERQKRPGQPTKIKWPFCEVDYRIHKNYLPVTQPDLYEEIRMPRSGRIMWEDRGDL